MRRSAHHPDVRVPTGVFRRRDMPGLRQRRSRLRRPRPIHNARRVSRSTSGPHRQCRIRLAGLNFPLGPEPCQRAATDSLPKPVSWHGVFVNPKGERLPVDVCDERGRRDGRASPQRWTPSPHADFPPNTHRIPGLRRASVRIGFRLPTQPPRSEPIVGPWALVVPKVLIVS